MDMWNLDSFSYTFYTFLQLKFFLIQCLSLGSVGRVFYWEAKLEIICVAPLAALCTQVMC